MTFNRFDSLLCLGMALRGCLAPPSHSLGDFLLHAFTIVVQYAEVELRFGNSLVGRLAVPSHGLGVIILRSLAIGVHVALLGLPFGHPCLAALRYHRGISGRY